MLKNICIKLEWEIADVLSQHPELKEEQASKILQLMEIRTDFYIDEGWEIMADCAKELFH